MTVRRDDVHDFAGNAVLVGERNAAKWMPHLLSELSLDHLSGSVLIVLERFADIGQQRSGDEIIPSDGNARAERLFQYIRDSNALPRAGIEMLDKPHVDVTR